MTAPIIETDGRAIVLDLGIGAMLGGRPVAGLDVDVLGALIDKAMADAGTRFAFGRWAEPRELYANDSFASDGGEMRTIHMGIDLFCAAGTPVHAPLDGVVEVVANNEGALDYGPLVILRHEASGFFTLYGHLSLDTLDEIAAGQPVRAGERIARVGAPPCNGNWPPHLHFQLINDLKGLGAGFPGVAPASSREDWLRLSPSGARFFPEIDSKLLEYS
ncbi:MAG: peptidoglycan DD-metalloendopeptidase family protein [Gammaproteobacteria bacterium]|nr:peptidoglycan DD-metalloendopeptidase family protein [Gammaproteobacteria bacterium]